MAKATTQKQEKRQPNEKVLREDLQFGKTELKAKGWKFDYNPENGKWTARTTKPSGDVFEIKDYAALKYLLDEAKHHQESWEAEETPTKYWSVQTPEELFKIIEADEKERTILAQNYVTSAEDEASQKKPLPTTVIASCRVELSDAEILARTYSMRHAQQEAKDEEMRFAREKDIYKSNLKAINLRVETYGHAIDSKSEYQDIECGLVYDFQRESVETVRPDTDEVIKRRGMTKEELQQKLF